MRILMFGWEFPPHHSGGLGIACKGLACALARAGNHVTFVLPYKLPGIECSHCTIVFADVPFCSETIPYSCLSGYITSERYDSLMRMLPSEAACIYGRTLFEKVHQYAERARALALAIPHDIIHAHDWLSFKAGLAAQRQSRKPLVAQVHATEFDRTGGQGVNQEVYDIEREGLQHAHAVIAVSHYTRSLIRRYYGISPEKVQVIYNAVDPIEYSEQSSLNLSALKADGSSLVLFVGRLTLQKGPDYFIKTAKRVLEFESQVKFLVVGAGDMATQLIQEVAYLGIGDKVIFTGFLAGEKLSAVYRTADLLVMPSVSEPFGLSALESLQYGVPVIISKQSGVSEVLKHALKVDFWDVEEMTNKIVITLRHKSLRDCLGFQGMKEQQRYLWRDAARICADLYARLMPMTVVS